MAREVLLQHGSKGSWAAGLLTIVLVSLGACATEQPKSSGPAVTPDQVRSHSDRGFENLKQEEQKRSANPAGTSY